MAPVYDPDTEVKQGGQSEKMPPGRHDVEISKILTARKDGELYKTKKGHKQIVVVFTNHDGYEIAGYYPLEGPARFRFSQLIHGIGENTASLKAKGFQDPLMLLTQKIADHWLLKKTLTVDVVMKDDRANVEIVLPGGDEPAPKQDHAARATATMRADVPFS